MNIIPSFTKGSLGWIFENMNSKDNKEMKNLVKPVKAILFFLFTLHLSLFTLLSCSQSIPNTSENTDKNVVKEALPIKGIALFPVWSENPSSVLPLRKKGSKVGSSPLLPLSKGGREGFNTKASLTDVGTFATVSLIKPSNSLVDPNKTIATGLTDSQGHFIINPSLNFTPVVGEIYVLEAQKRIENSDTRNLVTVRTFLKWNGDGWLSITTPDLHINTKTTAVTIITGHNPSVVTPEDTIGKVETSSGTSVPLDINTNISAGTVSSVADLVTVAIQENIDPYASVKFVNNKYSLDRGYDYGKTILAGKCKGCSLAGLDLSAIDLTKLNLADYDLWKADFSNVTFTTEDLSYLDLTQANFTGQDLRSVNLEGADLSEANLTNTNLSGKDLTKILLRGANFTNADLTGANLTKVNLFEAVLRNTKVIGADFSQGNLQTVDFSEIHNKDLTGTIFTGSDLTAANMSTLNLTNVDIFTDTKLTGAIFEETTFGVKDFSNKNLNNVNFKGAIFTNGTEGSAFTNANLANVDFSFSDLSYSDLSHLILTNIDFSNSNLEGSNFIGSNLTSSSFNSSNLNNVKFIEKDPQYIFVYSYEVATLVGVDFRNASVDNVQFINLNLSYSDLSGLTLNNLFVYSNLRNTNLTNTKFIGTSLPHNTYANCYQNTTYVDFRDAVFSETEFHNLYIAMSNYSPGAKDLILKYGCSNF